MSVSRLFLPLTFVPPLSICFLLPPHHHHHDERKTLGLSFPFFPFYLSSSSLFWCRSDLPNSKQRRSLRSGEKVCVHPVPNSYLRKLCPPPLSPCLAFCPAHLGPDVPALELRDSLAERETRRRRRKTDDEEIRILGSDILECVCVCVFVYLCTDVDVVVNVCVLARERERERETSFCPNDQRRQRFTAAVLIPPPQDLFSTRYQAGSSLCFFLLEIGAPSSKI